jgi:hypothetical protein
MSSANNTFIGRVTGFDTDADPLLYSIVTLDGCPVRMNSSGHVLVDRDAGLLNFEAKSLYTMVVSLMEVSNAMGALQYATQGNVTLFLRVVDVNEAPTFSALPTGYSVNEEAVNYTTVVPSLGGSFIVVTDEDGGNLTSLVIAVRSSAVGFSSSYFEIVRSSDNGTCRGGDNCILRVVLNRPAMDYDAGMRGVNVSLTVTDSKGAFTTASNFTVVVNDINQGPLSVVCYAFVCALELVVTALCIVVARYAHVLRSAVLHAVPDDEHDDPREQV